MQTRQLPSRRQQHRSCLLWLIPFVVLGCIGAVLVVSALPGLLLQAIGFRPQGNVEEFWEQVAVTPFEVVNLPPTPPAVQSQAGTTGPTPTPVSVAGSVTGSGGSASTGASGNNPYQGWFQSYSVPAEIQVSSGTGSVTLRTAESFAEAAWFGQAVDGAPLALISYNEQALDGICRTLLRGCVTDQFRVTAVDFHPGGLLVFGAVSLGGLTQGLGVLLVLGPDMKSVVAQGVVLNGQVYTIDVTADIASYVNQTVAQMNTALSQLRVQANGYSLGLVQIRLTDTTLDLIFR
ncbi:MAG: hypothetical protein HPY64_17665 [Anaerolineae bacterium]|nr:hypothetical protein [Anaerolineae bacterium]